MNIQAIKVGNIVNISINGKLHKKNCGSPKEADELFKLCLKTKANPTDENIKSIRAYLSEKLRVAYMMGLEYDIETKEVYLAGFNTPIPMTLVEVIKEYHENDYPIEPIINFWKLLMINPDVRVRESLFDFIKTHDFVLTDKGYMVVYKSVYLKENKVVENALDEFVSKQYLHIKNVWKSNPNKYVVYENIETKQLAITKCTTAEKWNVIEKGININGKIGELFENIIKAENKSAETENVQLYTDMYTKSMTIQLGVPVKQARKDCDANPSNDCSNGLHVGATNYVEKFANRNSIILVCLVNPMNVVAVPNYDHSKMRVDEYFPFAVANYVDGRIQIIEEKYFENDYMNIEYTSMNELITKIQSEEHPIEKVINSEVESRSMSELQKMIESRMIDIEEELN